MKIRRNLTPGFNTLVPKQHTYVKEKLEILGITYLVLGIPSYNLSISKRKTKVIPIIYVIPLFIDNYTIV